MTTNAPRKPRLVQDVLPFLTSLATHGVLVLIVVTALRALVNLPGKPLSTAQTLSPDMDVVSTDLPAGPPSLFDGGHSPEAAPEPSEMPAESGARFESDESSPLASDEAPDASATPAPNLIGLQRFAADDDSTAGGRGRRGAAIFGAPRGDGLGGTGGGSGIFILPPGVPGVRSVAYVCDASGSMLDKFDALRREIDRSVGGLKPIVSFNVIFFHESRAASLTGNASLLPATSENKRKASQFVHDTLPTGATDPLPALELALRQQPELIWLLTDGDFPDNDAVVQFLRGRNAGGRVRINTIAFLERGEGYEQVLKTIAQENGGTFRFISGEDLR